MTRPLVLASALTALLAAPALAQQPVWAGADRLRCDIEVANTCDRANCRPFQVLRVVLVDLAARRICASRDGAACAARTYEIEVGDQVQSGRLVVVVRNTGTTYSIAADGTMSGASVVSPVIHVFHGRCTAEGVR